MNKDLRYDDHIVADGRTPLVFCVVSGSANRRLRKGRPNEKEQQKSIRNQKHKLVIRNKKGILKELYEQAPSRKNDL